MMTLYVQARSKKELNERLSLGQVVRGFNYSMFGGGGVYELNTKLMNGTIIKVYDKLINGQPYAKAYGTWDGTKVK